MKKLKVVISGLHYPITMLRFFWEEFERREDIDLTVIGPYFGSWIPWNGGIEIDWKYVKVPQIPLPKEMARVHIHPQMVIDKLPTDIDLFLQIDAGWHFAVRPPGRVVALVKTDPHCLDYGVPKTYSDFSFCMQTPYMQPKDIFLPYACDVHHFYPEERPIVHDACLIGLQYEQRNRLVSRLRQKKLDVYYDIGVVYDEYRAKYNESRIALNWSSKDDLPNRVWEAFCMKRPLVTNRITDLGHWFVEGDHYLGFDTVEEAEHQVQRLLDDPDFAGEMADNAYRKVLAGHTWKDRVDSMLETMKLKW